MYSGIVDLRCDLPTFLGSERLTQAVKSAIYRAHRRGVPASVLACRHGRTRATIRRVINEMRARRILQRELHFVYNAVFDQPDADELILAPAPPAALRNSKSQKRPRGLPAYLASLYEIPLLTKEQELHLFRQMNYLIYRAHQLRARLDPNRARSSTLDKIERLQSKAVAVRNQIIRANLRLVVSLAKRHMSASHSFDELVSDGNMSLFRAVEHFDFARGNKFSTYATWAIRNNFASSIPREHSWRGRNATGHEELFKSLPDTRLNEYQCENEATRMRTAIALILKKLDDRERSIVIGRFGLNGHAEPRSLEEIGHEWGVSKERIRQIMQRAMGKLRQHAVEQHIEPPDERVIEQAWWRGSPAVQ